MTDPNTPLSGVSGTSPAPIAGDGNEVRSVSSDAGLGRGQSGATLATHDVIDVLNDLIETSRDGEKGFALAAKDSDDPALAVVFRDGERSCREATQQLQAQVQALGGKPEDRGTMKGAMHRGWVSLRTATTGRDAKAVLEECEKGEDYAKARYSAALARNLPADVRQLVERQYRGVIENHDRVRDLRNQYRAR
jgi:uncharacterized protein (TIGR02284 family)